MCTNGKEIMVKLNRPRESGRTVVPVDACIADKVQFFNDRGVLTLGSCCGHSKGNPHVLIHERSKELVSSLGYASMPYLYNGEYDGTLIVYLT